MDVISSDIIPQITVQTYFQLQQSQRDPSALGQYVYNPGELYNLCTFRDNMCTQGHFPTDEIVVSSTQAHQLGAIPQFLQLGFQKFFLLLLSNFCLDFLSSFSVDKRPL